MSSKKSLKTNTNASQTPNNKTEHYQILLGQYYPEIKAKFRITVKCKIWNNIPY